MATEMISQEALSLIFMKFGTDIQPSFYCTVHFSAEHGLANACRLSVTAVA